MYETGTSMMLADAIRRARSPVCWRVDEVLSHEALERLAALGAAFLFNEKRLGEEGRRLMQWLHHDYPSRLLFFDEGKVGDGEERRAFLERCKRVDVHGCVVESPSHTFLKQCVATERCIFVRINTQLPLETLSRTVEELLGKSRFNQKGRKNVGIALVWDPALLMRMEALLTGLPLFLSCSAKDWDTYPHAIAAAVIKAPEHRLIVLNAPSSAKRDAWWDAHETAARQLADALQGALANRAGIFGG